MNVYYNEHLINKNVSDTKEAYKLMEDYLKKKNIKSDYWRIVGLDNNKTMFDFGSWSNFFYIDCPVETFLQYD